MPAREPPKMITMSLGAGGKRFSKYAIKKIAA
jgi:hypothetical protein